MFKIGEFAALTQVAVSQLRYYDEIDLFAPARVDPDSGYRYYSADQIPALDRIIVLRELGFSLDQIRELQQRNLGSEDVWKILADRRDEMIEHVREEIARLRQLEARLEQFASDGNMPIHRVTVKAVGEQHYLHTLGADDDAHHRQMNDLYAGRHEIKGKQHLLTVTHDTRSDYPYEVGYVVDKPTKKDVTINGMAMRLRTLPAVDTMACLVYAGRWDDSHAATTALGAWLEQHDQRIAGPFRKVFLQIGDPATDERAVVELQIPVTAK